MPGREIVERHTAACMKAGLGIEGTNAEVMMGQWEFQIGDPAAAAHRRPALDGPLAALPHRRGSSTSSPRSSPSRSSATGTVRVPTRTSPPRRCARTAAGTPSSPAARRSGSGSRSTSTNYGIGIESRLTGAHETAHYTQFSYGTSDRGASIRIPWQTAKNKKGWLEDRRPNANMDPYVVSRLMVETVCGAAAGD